MARRSLRPADSKPTRLPHVPWLAVNLGLVWPGLGQLYSRQTGLGIGLAVVFLGLLWRGFWEIFAALGQPTAGFVYLAGAIALYLVSPWLAYRAPLPAGRTDRADSRAWHSLFLEQLLPGLGHLYLKQSLLGGTLLLVGVGLAYVANNQVPGLLPLAYGVWAISGYWAYRTVAHRSSWGLALLIVTGTMVIRLAIGYLPIAVDSAILQCIVPSESMQPTLMVDDRLFVRRGTTVPLQTGDIVVFQAPAEAVRQLNTEPETLFVKRIVGVAGDLVQVQGGQVWLNQQLLVEPYARWLSTIGGRKPSPHSPTLCWGTIVIAALTRIFGDSCPKLRCWAKPIKFTGHRRGSDRCWWPIDSAAGRQG